METLKEILFTIHSWCSNHWLITYIVGGIITYFIFGKFDLLQDEDEEISKYFNTAIWPITLPVLICAGLGFGCILLIGLLFSLPSKIIKLLWQPRKKKDKNDDYYCHI